MDREPGLTPSPYDAPDLYDLIFESLQFDVPYYVAQGRVANGPVLEVACGTGRVLLALLAAGVDADGFDLSEPMIERLREKAAERNLPARVSVADMRDFTLTRRYARAFCAFNAFAHCDTIDEQLRALRCIRDHLEPGGALVIHMSYPSTSLWLGTDGEPVFELETPHPLNDHRLQMWDTRFKNIVEQRQRSEVELRELTAGGDVVDRTRFETTQRWIYRFEFELLFRLAGFARWEIFGGFEHEALERDDQQMLAWAWRD